MVAHLPKDKHDGATNGVQQILTAGAVTHRTLEKLLGFLSFCARVIPLGRPFLRNLFNLLSSKDNWIADALSRFELHKIADVFAQFQSGDSSLRPRRETGQPMSELKQTFFGIDSLPTLAKSTELVTAASRSSL
jgi:hypothetical protein